MTVLLSRDEFRNSVFNRDNNKCVICFRNGKDAHHIMERRLFTEEHEFGGYFLDNGATLCESCHIKAESTELSTQQVRVAANIQTIVLPDHLYRDQQYDKWGNILVDGKELVRIKGELFNDESVQKILRKDIEWIKYIKYPRTYHLPWSEAVNDDDRVLNDLSFLDDEIVITLKMDGENTTIYNDYVHARSIDSKSDVSRNWIKKFAADIGWNLTDTQRLCGENLWAKHTIGYNELPSYFLLFSIWDGHLCLSWDETVEYAQLLGIETVPVVYRGPWFEKLPRTLMRGFEYHEGYVIRSTKSFLYKDFKKNVGKFVQAKFRRNMLDNPQHWFKTSYLQNKLK